MESRRIILRLPNRKMEELDYDAGGTSYCQDFGFEKELIENFGNNVKMEAGIYGDDSIKKTTLHVPENLLLNVLEVIIRNLKKHNPKLNRLRLCLISNSELELRSEGSYYC